MRPERPDYRAIRRRIELVRLFRARGSTGPDVQVEAEIDAAASAAKIDWLRADDDDAGEAFGLTLAERMKDYGIRRKRFCITTMNACDVTLAEQKAAYKARRRDTHNKRRRLRRIEQKGRVQAARALDGRNEATHALLSFESWSTIKDLCRALGPTKAFASSTGKHLPKESLRRSVMRAVDFLVKHGWAEKKLIRGKRHQPVCRVRRLRSPWDATMILSPGHQDKTAKPAKTPVF